MSLGVGKVSNRNSTGTCVEESILMQKQEGGMVKEVPEQQYPLVHFWQSARRDSHCLLGYRHTENSMQIGAKTA